MPLCTTAVCTNSPPSSRALWPGAVSDHQERAAMFRVGARIVAAPAKNGAKDVLRGTQHLLTQGGRDILAAQYQAGYSGGAQAVVTKLDTTVAFLEKSALWDDMARPNDISYYDVGQGTHEGKYATQGKGYRHCIPRVDVSVGEKARFADLLTQLSVAAVKSGRDAAGATGEQGGAPLVGASAYYTGDDDCLVRWLLTAHYVLTTCYVLRTHYLLLATCCLLLAAIVHSIYGPSPRQVVLQAMAHTAAGHVTTVAGSSSRRRARRPTSSPSRAAPPRRTWHACPRCLRRTAGKRSRSRPQTGRGSRNRTSTPRLWASRFRWCSSPQVRLTLVHLLW